MAGKGMAEGRLKAGSPGVTPYLIAERAMTTCCQHRTKRLTLSGKGLYQLFQPTRLNPHPYKKTESCEAA